MSKKKKARFFDPPNILREKIGFGGIEPFRLQRAEEHIETSPVDFTPIAFGIMERLNDTLELARAGDIAGKKAVDALTRPIMELKASGGMFRYMLVSHIADIVLDFLENIEGLNEDVFEIVDAHQNALSVIVTNRLQGSGGKEGTALAEELERACRRYYKKHDVHP